MRTTMSGVSIGLVWVWVAACGGHPAAPASARTDPQGSSGARGPSAASASPGGASGALAIVPLRLALHDEGHPAHVGALGSDGGLTFDGAPWARIDGSRVVAQDGSVLAEVSPTGGVTMATIAGTLPFTLTEDGRLTGPDETLVVNADGTIDAVRGSSPSRAPFAFDAMPPHGQRTAVLMFALMAPVFVGASLHDGSGPPADPARAPSASPSPAPETAPTRPHPRHGHRPLHR